MGVGLQQHVGVAVNVRVLSFERRRSTWFHIPTITQEVTPTARAGGLQFYNQTRAYEQAFTCRRHHTPPYHS
jgi:hypothetical protein